MVAINQSRVIGKAPAKRAPRTARPVAPVPVAVGTPLVLHETATQGGLPKEVKPETTLHDVHGKWFYCVYTRDQPSYRFETKWCSRKNKVRSLPRPATQHHRLASADSSQGSLLPHSSAYWDFQWMFPHWNSSCSFGRHSRGFFSEDPAQWQVQPPFATVHT